MARAVVALLIMLVAGGTAYGQVAQPSAPLGAQLAGPRNAPLAQRIDAVADLEDQVVRAVNAERVRRGLASLRINRQLALVARGHSTSMAEHGYFAHEAYDGSAFWRRIKAAYPENAGRPWSAGENLVWGSPDMSAQHAVEMWLGSLRHRANMLAPRWREVGVGAVHALGAPGVYEGLDVTVVTVDFGLR
jgi:uncharacterized protein YkwD